MRRHDELEAKQRTEVDKAAWAQDAEPPRLAAGTREMERLQMPETTAGFTDDEIAHIVHDLKNPLATIALETMVLECDAVDLDVTTVRRAASRIAKNVEFLDRMIHDLLDLCAIEHGRFSIRPMPTELRTVIERVVDRVVASRDHDRVFLRAPDPVTLEIDDLRIERVIANFLENAFKYAPQATGIVVRLDIDDEAACVSVIDAGPGLDEAERSSVFDKYRRGSTAGTSDGSGLGLYVSKRIVEAHGGRIGVDPVRGGGSRFFFELPLAQRR